MVDQIKTLGVDPETVQYIALTHTHPDHTGAVHHFQLYWSHIKLLASPIGARTLKKTELFRGFQLTDLGIAQLMNAKSEIESLPDPIDAYAFNVDSTIKEGDRIDLGKEITWTVHETPGHSPCHISLFAKKEGILALGDNTGFCVSAKDSIWSKYFDSLDKYCDSIRKLSTLNARMAILSHNGLIEGDIGPIS